MFLLGFIIGAFAGILIMCAVILGDDHNDI